MVSQRAEIQPAICNLKLILHYIHLTSRHDIKSYHYYYTHTRAAWVQIEPRRCQVTVLGKLFTPVVSLFTKQRNW